MTTLEADALARKLGLRFDGAQDPCGLAAATGSKEHEKMAFTCVVEGPALGTTFYLPLDATPEQVADRWNVKLAEIFAAEHAELKRKLAVLTEENAVLKSQVENHDAMLEQQKLIQKRKLVAAQELVKDLRRHIVEHHSYDIMKDELIICPACTECNGDALLNRAANFDTNGKI